MQYIVGDLRIMVIKFVKFLNFAIIKLVMYEKCLIKYICIIKNKKKILSYFFTYLLDIGQCIKFPPRSKSYLNY